MNVNTMPRPATGDDGSDLRAQVSCLMDGDEAGDRTCLDRVCSDDRLRGDWALWHVVGDAMRSSDVAALHSPRFAARMAQALEAEPAILAPRALRPNLHRTMRRFVLPGAAAAAAVAVISFIAVPMLRGDGGVGSSGPELARGAAQPAVVPVAASRPMAGAPIQPVQFERYVAAHSQMSGGLGLPRTSPYLRQTPAPDTAAATPAVQSNDGKGGR